MRYAFFVGIFFLFAGIIIIQAQDEDCPRIVEESVSQVANLCDSMDRNSACYGASNVESDTVVQPRPDNFFVAPGDQAELLELTEIRPSPLNFDTGTFGIGVLNVQANIPNTVPGQAVLLLVMGDARLTNEVPAESNEETPFQSFYFLPGAGQSPCYEAEPLLTIQTPGNITVTIALNGVETDFSPGTLLTLTADVCTIHRGNIIRRTPEGEIAAVLLANETVDTYIDEETGAIVVTNKRGISEREFVRGEQAQAALNSLAAANGWDEQFIIEPDEFDEEPVKEDDATAEPDGTDADVDIDALEEVAAEALGTDVCDETHIVAEGETMHAIAERYQTSVLGIVEANDLDNPRVIFPGQELCIPDVGSGFEPLPAGQ